MRTLFRFYILQMEILVPVAFLVPAAIHLLGDVCALEDKIPFAFILSNKIVSRLRGSKPDYDMLRRIIAMVALESFRRSLEKIFAYPLHRTCPANGTLRVDWDSS